MKRNIVYLDSLDLAIQYNVCRHIAPSKQTMLCRVYSIAPSKQTMYPNTTPPSLAGTIKYIERTASIIVVPENDDFMDILEAQSCKWEVPLEPQAQWDQRATLLHGFGFSSPTNHQID